MRIANISETDQMPKTKIFKHSKTLIEIQRQMKCYPKLTPHCVMVDGNGLLHFRKFGIACHIGVLTDLPTIGISKDHWRYPSRPCNAKEIRTIQRNKVNVYMKCIKLLF